MVTRIISRGPTTGTRKEVKVAGSAERALAYRGGETIEWKVVA